MKGVIVQIGEPKSIVLFNNGKIRAIPTPADCHVGMVVSVEFNNRLKIIAIICSAVFLVALGVILGGIFLKGETASPVYFAPPPSISLPESREVWDRDNRLSRQILSISVEQAKLLPDDAKVLLTGNITESLGDEKYMFCDSSGEIIVEIERKLLRNFSVNASDVVEIIGEVDVERRQIIVDVDNIKKK